MKFIGNLIWFIFVGLWEWILFVVSGLFYCITIIGIPIGMQCFKFAKLSVFPFGKEVNYGGGIISMIANIIWIFLPGLEAAIGYVVAGLILCITIVGIPFGKQCFKIAKLVLMPFGSTIA